MAKLKLGFLASHGGSNLQAIIDSCKEGALDGVARAVISNSSRSGARTRAENEGVPFYYLSSVTHPDPAALDAAILAVLQTREVQVVCLAGYMKKLGERTLAAYRGRILNIHPALLPKYGGRGMYGMRVHEAVLAAGERESGATVHLIDGEYDHGPVLAQEAVPVQAGDTPELLQGRVLQVEHRLYAATLQKIADGRIVLEDFL
ncbi:MAG: phosphoribosylglycinamide formyltransferase-1 [Candidatus Latescibacterota bacterium]